jgi:hypothetical protein
LTVCAQVHEDRSGSGCHVVQPPQRCRGS